MKRSKIPEGLYGSTLLYFRFFILWALVILADFILEFRFEFLWPFYLLLRSVYDSFKYQGLAFSVFFVCVALTSDMLCFFFIPVHWLFFAASTYVWVQYVWHTDKGICGPTIVLWMLFVYIEAAVRLRDVKHMPGHMDLCRPFAAHCIGYPVVTLGFGFKSYVGFRMRQKKQRDVAKENEFYLQLMQQALPAEAVHAEMQQPAVQAPAAATATASAAPVKHTHKLHNGNVPNGLHANGVPQQHHPPTNKAHRRGVIVNEKVREHGHDHDEHQHTTTPTANGATSTKRHGGSHKMSNGVCSVSTEEVPGHETPEAIVKPVNNRNRRERKEQSDKDNREHQECLLRLEQESKRLRLEIQSSRASEQELRLQVVALTTTEKVSRGEMLLQQRELEDLHAKLQSANSSKAQDKQTINSLERRLAEERRVRNGLELQLNQERKSRKQEEARAAAAAAQAQSIRAGECTDLCRQRRRELESDVAAMRSTHKWYENEVQLKDRDGAVMADKLRETDLVISAMQEKTQHLENSLSAETRIKLDLFSALGEVKRQLEIKDNFIRAQEKEIEELKSKIAQVLAVMPDTYVGSPGPSHMMSRVRLSANAGIDRGDNSPGSTLDPNATAYTPKGSLVASTEA